VCLLCGGSPSAAAWGSEGDTGDGPETDVVPARLTVRNHRWSLREGRVEEKEASVSLMVIRQTNDMVGLDVDKSEVKSFTDDEGTDLLQAGEGGTKPEIATTGASGGMSSMNVDVRASRLPSPNAEKLVLSGTLAVIIGMNRTTVENRDVEIAEGREINAGPAMLKITKVGTPDFDKHPWAKDRGAISITIEGDSSKGLIRGFQFRNEDGNNVGAAMASATHPEGNADYTVFEYLVYGFSGKLTVTVSYWATMETVLVPFDLEVGIDLEEGWE
jgi:hypothetical protein